MGRGPIDLEMEKIISTTQTDQTTEKEMIREDKEHVDMEEKEEGRGRPSSPEELPSREEDAIEMEEL